MEDDSLHHQSVSPSLLLLHHLCPLAQHLAAQLNLVQIGGRLLLWFLLLHSLKMNIKYLFILLVVVSKQTLNQ